MINPFNFIETIENTIKQHHRVVVRNPRDEECRSTLNSLGFNLHVYWELAYRVEGSVNTIVPCICLNDGNISFFATTHLRKGKVRCNGCRIEKYKKFASLNNSTYISHRSNGSTCLVKTQCNVDGYYREVPSSELFENKITCPVCYEKQYREFAENLGFEFMSFIVTSNNRTRVLVRCPHDGYIRCVGTSELINQKIKCKICQVNNYSNMLSTKNCRYLQHYTETVSEKTTTYVEYSTPSNLILRVVASNLNKNKFAVTEDTHWNQQHSVYCIRTVDESTGNEYIKIGTANFPELRLAEFKLLYPANTVTLASFDTRNKASKLEKYLHKYLKEHKASPLDVDHMIGRVIKSKTLVNCLSTKDGCTEWFKGSALKELEGLDYSGFK